MKKSFLAAALLLCMLLAGCSNGGSAALKSAAEIDSIPSGAKLVHTFEANSINGTGVKLEEWENADETGFFVIEISYEGGSIAGFALTKWDGDAVASFGDIKQNRLYITDIVTDGAHKYTLRGQKFKQFKGRINVYFVSGIGYDTGD